MKRVWLSVLALWFAYSSMAIAQEPPEVTVFTFGDTSCAAWTKSQANEAVRAQYQAWIRGFVSGYNYGNSANQVPSGAMPSPDDVSRDIDKYCRDNPALAFIGIVTPLILEHREHRMPVPMQKP